MLRHIGTSETVAVLHRDAEEVFFEEDGKETDQYRLKSGGVKPSFTF
jgi:hypothetical protein